MAQIKRRAAGQWRARIRRKGYPEQSATFPTKQEADAWAREIENQLDKGIIVDTREAGRTTLKEALERYRSEITSKKQSNQPEKSRITSLVKSELAGRSLLSIRGGDLAEYRDARMLGVTIAELRAARDDDLEADEIKPTRRVVGANSVRLELALISHLYTIARTEWGMEGLPNPVMDIRKPKLPGARKRRLEEGEEDLLLDKASPPLRDAIILAIETAMRRGELCSIERRQIHKGKKIAHLEKTKNGDERDVPLSPRALKVIESLPTRIDGSLLGISADWLSHAFEDLTAELKIKDLHFHDLRREAISRLFERGLGIEEVRTISGHKTLQMLTVYTKLRGEDLVKKLA